MEGSYGVESEEGSKVVEDPMKDPIEKDSILTLPLKLNVVNDEH